MIEEFPTDTTATEGEGVFFKVVVRGYPQPSLIWYHEDTQLTSDYSLELTQDGSLSIVATELKHSGVYKLLAKNSSGSVEREVRLTVRQEEEEAAPVARERVDVQPVSVAEFGDYVAYCHSNSDEIFKYQYMVGIMLELNEIMLKLFLEHSYSDSSNLIGQFEVPYFHSDTVYGTTCSALALRAWLFYM